MNVMMLPATSRQRLYAERGMRGYSSCPCPRLLVAARGRFLVLRRKVRRRSARKQVALLRQHFNFLLVGDCSVFLEFDIVSTHPYSQTVDRSDASCGVEVEVAAAVEGFAVVGGARVLALDPVRPELDLTAGVADARCGFGSEQAEVVDLARVRGS